MSTMNPQENFFQELKAFRGEKGVSDISNYVDVPSSWHIVLTDVRGSTKAIQAGRYKDVNMVGAASIAAVCNAWSSEKLPYVFGGDGATFLVPSSRLESVLAVLESVSQMAKDEFDLELRVGSLGVAEVLSADVALKIAKQELSPKIFQAIFAGGALARAEEVIKKRGLQPISSSQQSHANYEGLECRWQPIESRSGEILSVLVRTQSTRSEESFRVYKEVIEEIELITGGAQVANPARKNDPQVTLNPGKLMHEWKVRSAGRGWKERFDYALKLFVAVLFGKVFFAFRLKFGGVDWGAYKDEVVQNSDFWKFDEMLRFVLDVSPVQKRALLSCLDKHFKQGEIVYGVHSSKSALMTCLVFDRAGGHVHFMDGNDGGYALAAVGLKKQLQDLQTPSM